MNNEALTYNECVTNETSTNKNVDFFFLAGASRDKDITSVFKDAMDENPDFALRILAFTRDIRGGYGERQTFKNLLVFLEKEYPDYADAFIKHIPELGRFDDLLVFETEALKQKAYALIRETIDDGIKAKDTLNTFDSLSFEAKNELMAKIVLGGNAAKWMPRKGSKAIELRKFFGMTPKEYRKYLVNSTNVVETLMCSNKWNDIEYSSVPSLAFSRYTKAFNKHSPERFQSFINQVEKGEEKISTGAVYPYNIVNSCRYGNSQAANAQWEQLPNYMEGNKRVLPVVDVSGSMIVPVSGSITAMDVAVSLGIYMAERQEGQFKNMFCTFSTSPELVSLKGNTLKEKMENMKKANWCMSTDLEEVFSLILNIGTTFNLENDKMPEYIIILSDMEFNEASNSNLTMYETIKEKYIQHGYDLPKVIFWNINGRMGNIPVKVDDSGTALVSGFSPSIAKAVLSVDDIRPDRIMINNIMKDRYKII